MMNPKISVLLPVWNAAPTLLAAVESICRQTFENWEMLIVDNGSSDATPDILQRFVACDKRIRLLHLPEPDLVAALNYGLKHCRGSYVARMDADDVSQAFRFERQASWLDSRPGTGLVSCLVRHGGDSASQAGYAAYVDWINSLVTDEQISRNRFVESPFAHPSVMFRRELAARFGAWRDGAFPEDYELWLRWLECGVRMEKIPEVLLVWNDPPRRLSRVDARYAPEAFYRMKANYLRRWLQRSSAAKLPLYIWGAGRETRKRLRALLQDGIKPDMWVDIDPRKCGQRIDGVPVVSPDALPSPGQCFVLSAVASRGARQQIAAALELRGYIPGVDFLLGG